MIANIISDFKMKVMVPFYLGKPQEQLDNIKNGLPSILKQIGENEFLCGSKPTYVDFYFFETVELIVHVKEDAYEEYPALKRYRENVANLPGLKEYLNDPNCIERTLPFVLPGGGVDPQNIYQKF